MELPQRVAMTIALVATMLISTLLMPWLGFLVSGFVAFGSIMLIAMYDPWTRFRKLVYPLVWISTRLTRLFSHTKGEEITREEIIALASLGHRDGTLFAQENEYLANLLKLREIKTEQILTSRSVVNMRDQRLTVTDAPDLTETK